MILGLIHAGCCARRLVIEHLSRFGSASRSAYVAGLPSRRPVQYKLCAVTRGQGKGSSLVLRSIPSSTVRHYSQLMLTPLTVNKLGRPHQTFMPPLRHAHSRILAVYSKCCRHCCKTGINGIV